MVLLAAADEDGTADDAVLKVTLLLLRRQDVAMSKLPRGPEIQRSR